MFRFFVTFWMANSWSFQNRQYQKMLRFHANDPNDKPCVNESIERPSWWLEYNLEYEVVNHDRTTFDVSEKVFCYCLHESLCLKFNKYKFSFIKGPAHLIEQTHLHVLTTFDATKWNGILIWGLLNSRVHRESTLMRENKNLSFCPIAASPEINASSGMQSISHDCSWQTIYPSNTMIDSVFCPCNT